jgi:Rv2632c-like
MALSRSMIRKLHRMYHNTRAHSSAHPMVTLAVDERRGRTYATAELQWGSSHLAGHGVAYRHPADYLASETGQELATARALSDLADQVTALSRAKN